MTRFLAPSVLVAALSLPLVVIACAKTTDIGATRVACTSFGPIGWSVNDTDETIRQVKEHNARFAAVCPE